MKKNAIYKKPALFIAVCTVPTLVLTLYFTILPTLQALYLSFTDASRPGGRSSFIFLENYEYMFGDKYFVQALGNTFKLMLVVPVITLTLSLVLAFILSQVKLREKGFYRTVFFFPSIVSMTVVGVIWSFVFHPTMGILNSVMEFVGLGGLTRPWIGDSQTALWCVGVALIWQAVGYYMVMHIAAMDGISPEIYESATIDGASGLRKMLSITFPLIKDIIGITFVLSLSGTINLSYVLSSVMTGGGPNGASRVLLQYIYNQAMHNSNFGYAMSITVFTLGISIVLSMASRWMTNRQEG